MMVRYRWLSACPISKIYLDSRASLRGALFSFGHPRVQAPVLAARRQRKRCSPLVGRARPLPPCLPSRWPTCRLRSFGRGSAPPIQKPRQRPNVGQTKKPPPSIGKRRICVAVTSEGTGCGRCFCGGRLRGLARFQSRCPVGCRPGQSRGSSVRSASPS